jgi:uncharacterized protein YciI
MAGFVFKLLGPEGMSPTNMTDEQRDIMGRHAGYWAGLLETGNAVAFGPVIDGDSGYGIGIVRADDADHAQSLADADPATLSGKGFRTEISPMLVLVTQDGRE